MFIDPRTCSTRPGRKPLSWEPQAAPGPAGWQRRCCCALGAALLPAGLRRRRHAPLLGFMGCVACLAVELHFAITLAAETWLILCGIAAMVAGFALDRYLRQPRKGVTSQPLEDRGGALDLLQTAGAALLAQRATPEAPRAEPGVTPGEGRFGGGGASGQY